MAHKLLLADDSVTIQRVIELTFAEEDIDVIAVGNGREAIARIEADQPDVILADAGMPERDGFQVASYVKAHPQLAQIPVLLLTGAFEPVDEAKARAAGCDGVLVKPFEPQMVINRVKDLLAGRRPASLWARPPDAPEASEARSPAPRAPAPPAAFEPTPAPAQPSAASESTPAPPAQPSAEHDKSLDEYFDRLDSVFSNAGSPEAFHRASAGTVSGDPALRGGVPTPTPFDDDELDRLEPDLADAGSGPDSVRNWNPALPVEPLAGPGWLGDTGGARPDAIPAGGSAVAPTPSAMPALSDAFEALLAAEQNRSVPVAGPAAPPGITPETIDLIVERVVERLTGDAVRATVADVAERLVREEIARIKSSAH
jgi:CheY-like chemotaxis protein